MVVQRKWKDCAEEFGVVGVVAYELRHSGASVYLPRGWRTLPETQKRGRLDRKRT